MPDQHSWACCRLGHERQSWEWNNTSPRCMCSGSDVLRPDDKDVVSFFKCALNFRLLSRMAQRRNRVMSSQIFLWPMKRAGCQLKLPDQVEKGHTSVLLAFRTPVQHRVNYWLSIFFGIFKTEDAEAAAQSLVNCSEDWDIIAASKL